jgi:hypothetical protein
MPRVRAAQAQRHPPLEIRFVLTFPQLPRRWKLQTTAARAASQQLLVCLLNCLRLSHNRKNHRPVAAALAAAAAPIPTVGGGQTALAGATALGLATLSMGALGLAGNWSLLHTNFTNHFPVAPGSPLRGWDDALFLALLVLCNLALLLSNRQLDGIGSTLRVANPVFWAIAGAALLLLALALFVPALAGLLDLAPPPPAAPGSRPRPPAGRRRAARAPPPAAAAEAPRGWR